MKPADFRRSLTVRPATPTDAVLLSRLTTPIQQMHARAHPEVFKIPEDEQFAVSFWQQMLSAAGHYTFIAEVDGEAVGYILMREYFGEDSIFTRARHYLEVDQLAVLPEHQGQGAGGALIEKAHEIATALDCERIFLGVWEFNAAAQGFYQRLGYRTFQRRMWREL